MLCKPHPAQYNIVPAEVEDQERYVVQPLSVDGKGEADDMR